MKTIELIVKTGNQKYPIIIGNNILNKLQVLLKKKLINYNQCIIIIIRLNRNFIFFIHFRIL